MLSTNHEQQIDTLCAHRRKLKLDKLKRRGKGPPKKGQGKRASKGKAKAAKPAAI